MKELEIIGWYCENCDKNDYSTYYNMEADCFYCCYDDNKYGHYIMSENKNNNDEKQFSKWKSHKVHNKEEVETHLEVITKYLNFITSLRHKYFHENYNVWNKLVLHELVYYKVWNKSVLHELVYYSDGTLKRLCKVFDYILDNFKRHDNFFLTEYRLLRLENRISIERICRYSLEMTGKIDSIKEILEIQLRIMNGSDEVMDEAYLKMIT